MKALHPADNAPPWAGVPLGGSWPTVVMEYEGMLRVTAPAPGDPTWSADLSLVPNPVQPLSVYAFSAGGTATYHGLRNSTLGGDAVQFGDNVSKLETLASHWRITHMSLTTELDAPALANQGSVVAAQIPLNHLKLNTSWVNLTNLPTAGDNGALIVGQHVTVVDLTQNLPDPAVLSTKPLAYQGLAKDGTYQVLKLDPRAPWVSTADTSVITVNTNATVPGNAGYPNSVLRGVVLPKNNLGTASALQPWPFYSSASVLDANKCISAHVNPAFAASTSGSQIPGFPQPLFGRTVYFNMSGTAALTMRVRWGVEYVPQVSSVFAPAQKAPAALDELALEFYARFAAVAPDAYPASYNSWDELSAYLRKAYSFIRPALRFASHLPGVAGMAAGGAQALGDLVVKPKKTDRKPEVVPQKPPDVQLVRSTRKIPKSAAGVRFKR